MWEMNDKNDTGLASNVLNETMWSFFWWSYFLVVLTAETYYMSVLYWTIWLATSSRLKNRIVGRDTLFTNLSRHFYITFIICCCFPNAVRVYFTFYYLFFNVFLTDDPDQRS